MDFKFKNNKKIYNIHEGRVPYLSFERYDREGLINAFTTKFGGASEGVLASMNLSYSRGDSPENVYENYRRLAEELGVDMEKMVVSKQTHTTNVRKVTEEDLGKGVVRERDYDDIDGLITDLKGVTLVTFYADCIPLYFYAPDKECIGLSHSGWRGTAGRMGHATVEKMKSEYGISPEKLICAIGPGICSDCFETDAGPARIFLKEFPEAEPSLLVKELSDENPEDDLFSKDISVLKKSGVRSIEDITEGRKYFVDLWYANRLVLEGAGVKLENIITGNICTRCNHELLYSHRICGEKRGNLAALLCMKEEKNG